MSELKEFFKPFAGMEKLEEKRWKTQLKFGGGEMGGIGGFWGVCPRSVLHGGREAKPTRDRTGRVFREKKIKKIKLK